MKLRFKGLSNIQKIILFIVVVFIVSIAVLQLFIKKSEEVVLYDDMTTRVSAMRASISKLEYLLDMFVVARRFESTTMDLIKKDVKKLDDNFTNLFSDSKYMPLLSIDTPLSENLVSMGEDWQHIDLELSRLNAALNQDEIMLIHNAVDTHTVLIIENTDRLLSVISESRQEVFDEIRSLEIKSIAAVILFTIIASIIYYKKVSAPLRKAGSAARRVASGNFEARFREDALSPVGKLGAELNLMLEALALEREELKALNSASEERLAFEGLKIRSFTELMSFASSSLALGPVLEKAVSKAVSHSGADAGAVFIEENGELVMKACTGFGSGVAKALQQHRALLPGEGERGAASPALFPYITEYPDASLVKFLESTGFESLARLPILYNNGPLGYMFVFYRHRADDIAGVTPFMEAVCSGAAVALGHSRLYQGEHGSRRFIERIVNQVPFGLAVFDKSGTCRVINGPLKKMLGADRTELVGEYSIFDDEVLTSRGILPSIKKAYEGYATEFTINYDPADMTQFSFTGPRKRLKIKSFPLYDSGGDISNIVLLYEDICDLPGAGVNSGDDLG